MDLVSQPTPSAYADAALLSHFRTPYVGPAEREAATAAAAKAARASAVAHRPLLSPRRPLPSSPRHLAPVALPVLPDGSEGLGEHEMVNARLMLGMGTGLRRTPRWR
eukprot:Transcript_2466.p4 GENE.Transcript_2466~~Transcript_2466.p4  ORF type:complete len:107 (-),score=31.22 Transcript_2466:67-387(-)